MKYVGSIDEKNQRERLNQLHERKTAIFPSSPAASAAGRERTDPGGERGGPLWRATASLAGAMDAARAAGRRRRLSDERHRHHDAVQALRPGGRRQGRPDIRQRLLARRTLDCARDAGALATGRHPTP